MSLIGFFVLGGNVMFADGRSVKVIHGANDGEFDLAGSKVSTVRASLVDAFNISQDAIAFVNGHRVANSYQLRVDDVIEFVRERGVKGAGKKPSAAPADDDDDQNDAQDISGMGLDELAAFVDGQLGKSHEAQQRSFLQAHKSAVHLFWAGCALYKARELCDAKGHGEWNKFKAEHSLADTTANDAIRLFKNAKTPDALVGMGITEAKTKFVYPAKDERDENSNPKAGPKAKGSKAATGGLPKSTSRKKPSGIRAGENTDDLDDAAVDQPTVIDPAESVAATLEEIAQQLNEIAQDQLGKVDLQKHVSTRLLKALIAVAEGVKNIRGRIKHE
jgi:hypothetical protein